MIRGVTHAIVLMQVRDEHELSPVACWPACGDTPPALLATARDAIRRQQEIVCQRDASTLLTEDSGGVLACPVMTGSRMTGVVAMAIGQHGEPERQAALEQLRCGCTWLTMLVRRESESGKHYLATMLEMAAMFLEHRQPQTDDAADPVITHIIDALNERLGTDASTLLQQIQATVHHARGLESLYTGPATQSEALVRDLPGALEEDQLVLHYQPKVDLKTGRIASMEALLRWEHPTSGLLPPESILPVAGQSGLMPAIDDWVLRTACRQLQAWHACGHRDLSVAVNLSGAGFMQPRLVRQLLNVTREYGIARDRLEIEVTECDVMDNIDNAAGVIRSLHDAGIRVTVDDFGTGYSSLNYLNRFPISTIKIDRSFVRDITSDADIATIVRGIIAMAHASGLEVVAAGVETEAQLAFLRKLQCDRLQGYLFSRPLEPGAAMQMLEMEARAGSLLDYAERAS
jgi:EAL domain-containing protein (putative c-di-GMP-specific phosphodiesterase class I)